MKHLSVKIPPELMERIDRAARNYVRSRSNMVVFLVENGLRELGYAALPQQDRKRAKK